MAQQVRPMEMRHHISMMLTRCEPPRQMTHDQWVDVTVQQIARKREVSLVTGGVNAKAVTQYVAYLRSIGARVTLRIVVDDGLS